MKTEISRVPVPSDAAQPPSPEGFRSGGMDDKAILQELEELARATFLLWDERWMGFSWRHYYFNHTQRVRALSLEIGRREGADLRKIEYAALLHDITKRYDGRIVSDKDGNRIVDENGFWRNELSMPNPDRQNKITELYRAHRQFYKLHNISGGFIAQKLLQRYGLPDKFCRAVETIIRAHLKPDAIPLEEIQEVDCATESKALYEADTIDANLGLVAFFRNIHIYTHRTLETTEEVDPPGRLRVGDLRKYIEHLPRWLDMKEDFVGRMMTDTGRQIARARQGRKREIYRQIEEEQARFDLSLKYGLLGIVQYFMDGNGDPDLRKQMDDLHRVWIPERARMLHNAGPDTGPAQTSFDRAVHFCRLMEGEISGKI